MRTLTKGHLVVHYHRDRESDRKEAKYLTTNKEPTAKFRNWSWLKNGTWEVTDSVADTGYGSMTASEQIERHKDKCYIGNNL